MQNFIAQPSPKLGLRTMYLIWKDPWMAAGNQTFIHTVLEHIGLTNALEERSRYPSFSASKIQKINPALVLLSSEPYPFRESHIAEVRALLPQAQIGLVDGEAFSWYGSHILKKIDYLSQLGIRLNV